MSGRVYLVGGGPGDPGLITARGIECLRRADVVLYDRLVNPELLKHAAGGAELIYAGKAARDHALSQGEINELLVQRAVDGKVVVRLKGGDPFVFGRGGEEVQALAAAGISFEVVPGVTSAIAVAAYAGIPVTHRGVASSFAVITGHEDPTKPQTAVDWSRLAGAADTLVLLMGVENLPRIVEQLTRNGRPPETPVALVRSGTWPQQETLAGTLATIVGLLDGRSFRPPAVIIVGETVGLREGMRWFDNRPLSGKRVLVTRAREQASRLSELLREHGADTIEAPAIEIADPEDWGPLDAALARLGGPPLRRAHAMRPYSGGDGRDEYDWVVFTSANAVEAVFRRLSLHGLDARAFAGCRVAAVGPATAEAVHAHGITPDLVPAQYLTEAVARELAAQGLSGQRVLLPRTDIVDQRLDDALAGAGAEVEQVVAYRTLQARRLDGGVLRLLETGGIDVVTFASASTVKNLVGLLDGRVDLLARPVLASIGPVTSKAARDAGLRVDVEAGEHTIPGLVQAIVEGGWRP